jgi:hypothetical protein
MNSLAKKGNAEGALTFAAQANQAGANTSQYLMERLSTYGHVREAEKVLSAAQPNPNTFSNLAWTLVEKAAQAEREKAVA